MNLPHLWSLRNEDLQTHLQTFGIEERKARFHSKQIFQWLYQRKVTDVDLMTDLSKQVRSTLKEKTNLVSPLKEVARQQSVDGTTKFLFKLHDGHTIESVLIPAGEREEDCDSDNEETALRVAGGKIEKIKRVTICISSQVGCAMGCKFCLTASMGFIRNLTIDEIVGQVFELSKHSDITNIVFMGMGEPLHNFENVCRAIEILLNPDGLKFSKRKVTLSTSGLVPQIRKLNDRLKREHKVNLAISLNGSYNAQREMVMPVNKAFPIEDLLDACKNFDLGPHRRVTFEYVLLGELNDSIEDAERVLKLLKGMPSKLNLIPFNPHPTSEFKRPSEATVFKFQKYLMDRGATAMIRHSRGRDILAACGQLKSAEDKKQISLN